jgi:hypothetical protein
MSRRFCTNTSSTFMATAALTRANENATRPAHRRGRVHRHDLADHKPIEQMADRGKPLLGGRPITRV